MQNLLKTKQLTVMNVDSSSLIEFSPDNLLIIDKVTQEIKLLNNNNEIQLLIKVTPEGLAVTVNAARLNVHANEELNLTSKKINIEASEQINIKTSGNITQEIGKDYLTEVDGINKNIAKIQKITASLGNIELKANDDVRLDGESVKLNCDE